MLHTYRRNSAFQRLSRFACGRRYSFWCYQDSLLFLHPSSVHLQSLIQRLSVDASCCIDILVYYYTYTQIYSYTWAAPETLSHGSEKWQIPVRGHLTSQYTGRVCMESSKVPSTQEILEVRSGSDRQYHDIGHPLALRSWPVRNISTTKSIKISSTSPSKQRQQPIEKKTYF